MVSSDVIFIPVLRMLKVRPTSLLFVLVWNTPAGCGTHILKSIAMILKEYSGKLPDRLKTGRSYSSSCHREMPNQGWVQLEQGFPAFDAFPPE